MSAAATQTQAARGEAAARAAIALLPASTELSVGTPTKAPAAVQVAGQAVRARFSGAAQGEIAVVVGQDLVEALASSPMGSLDVTQAVRPALEAAAATLGPVVVDPGELLAPADALAALAAAGAVLVPLTDGTKTRAVVALCVTGPTAPTPRQAPASTGGARPAFDLLHDVEMEVTAELGRTRMSVRELLSLAPGAVIELDRAAGGPADLLVNGRLIARGEVVVIDENFGIRITEIVA
jgi:flagellar motor switch protein FliN/FliY